MIGKKIIVNDYKFTYGKEAVYMNAFGAIVDDKGNKYIVYNYSNNKKLYYGSLFINGKMGTVMISGSENLEIIKSFINSIVNNKEDMAYKNVSLNDVETIQIIDEKPCDFEVNVEVLYSKTIPKEIVKETKEEQSSGGTKKISFPILLIILLFAGIGIFFLVNTLNSATSKQYLCTKNYKHEELPANVTEERTISFNGEGKLTNLKITFNYAFTSSSNYTDFKDNNASKYMEENDAYKEDDDTNTYRIFRNVIIDKNFILPKEENRLITYYTDNGYSCNIKEE